jgi:hypothetical protein
MGREVLCHRSMVPIANNPNIRVSHSTTPHHFTDIARVVRLIHTAHLMSGTKSAPRFEKDCDNEKDCSNKTTKIGHLAIASATFRIDTGTLPRISKSQLPSQ